jgi:hypothetical protein
MTVVHHTGSQVVAQQNNMVTLPELQSRFFGCAALEKKEGNEKTENVKMRKEAACPASYYHRIRLGSLKLISLENKRFVAKGVALFTPLTILFLQAYLIA